MIIKTIKSVPGHEITDPKVFQDRRKIIKAMLGLTAMGVGIRPGLADASKPLWPNLPKYKLDDDLTPSANGLIQNYTNYYEFSFKKEDATLLAQKLPIDPWSVEISGEVEQARTFYLEEILQQQILQEYVYRFRCVEAWSMVIPWVGFSLADLLKKVKPLSTAKFVKFTSVYQPDFMPNQKQHAMLQWPYVEGLRIDEAIHPLAIMAVGLYGDTLPKQNGAPLRLVVPWKYGFKSIKAVVKIELLKRAPITTWNAFAPNEYGFYANVNPLVPHPRWSQNSERPLGSGFFSPRRETELFNGYAGQVAGLYKDMDLRHFF